MRTASACSRVRVRTSATIRFPRVLSTSWRCRNTSAAPAWPWRNRTVSASSTFSLVDDLLGDDSFLFARFGELVPGLRNGCAHRDRRRRDVFDARFGVGARCVAPRADASPKVDLIRRGKPDVPVTRRRRVAANALKSLAAGARRIQRGIQFGARDPCRLLGLRQSVPGHQQREVTGERFGDELVEIRIFERGPPTFRRRIRTGYRERRRQRDGNRDVGS